MPRPKKYVLLDERDRAFLYHLKERYRKGGALSNAERQHLSNLRHRTMTFLQELSSLTKELPEDQQAQIFVTNKLQPLIDGLLGKHLQRTTVRHFELAKFFIDTSIPICQESLDFWLGPKTARYLNRILLETREMLDAVAKSRERFYKPSNLKTVSSSRVLCGKVRQASQNVKKTFG